MHFRFVCLIKLVSVIRFGLDFTHDAFYFYMSHVHAFFMDTFFRFFPILSMCYILLCSLSLSLSLLDRTFLWHPNRENPLRLRILFMVPGHPLLIPLFHLISDSVMRRPRWTSLRTFKTMVFIQNTRSFCQISPTLLYPKSFELGDRSPSMGNPRVSGCVHSGVLLQHACYRYLCASVCYDIQRYTYRSYFKSYIRGTTCS